MDGDHFLVIGAGGNVGSEVTRALQARGHVVRAPQRNGGRRLPEGVLRVAGDLRTPATRDDATGGVRGIFLMAGTSATRELLATARDRGVTHVVLLSTPATLLDSNQDALTSFHRRAEKAVTESGLDWTLLHPQAFASNALQWLPQLVRGNKVGLPFPDLPLASIDPRDIGEVAAAALLDPGHHGTAPRLTGPRALLPAEQVEILGESLGRPLEAVPLDDTAAREHMLATTPPALVDAFFQLYRTGGLDESVVTDTVRGVLGRPARTFENWVSEHQHRFQASARM